jgi:hypothetical protein
MEKADSTPIVPAEKNYKHPTYALVSAVLRGG